VHGNVNVVAVSHTVAIRNMKSENPEVRQFESGLVNFISGCKAKGCPVSIQIEDDPT
jgi:hypothetical protein